MSLPTFSVSIHAVLVSLHLPILASKPGRTRILHCKLGSACSLLTFKLYHLANRHSESCAVLLYWTVPMEAY